MWFVLLAVVILMIFSACGAPAADRDDERYHTCLDAGGSYQSGDGGDWSCNVPKEKHGEF